MLVSVFWVATQNLFFSLWLGAKKYGKYLNEKKDPNRLGGSL